MMKFGGLDIESDGSGRRIKWDSYCIVGIIGEKYFALQLA
jgi:hypothetical protein